MVNKMDRTGADFERVVRMMKERLAANPVPIQLPLGKEDSFRGIIDLVRMKAVVWEEDTLGAKFHDEPVPDGMAQKSPPRGSACSRRWLTSMTRSWKGTCSDRRSRRGVDERDPAGHHRNRITPVVCGTAFRNKGVQPMLDAVVDYLPSPLDILRSSESTRTTRARRSASLPTTSRSRRSPSRS